MTAAERANATLEQPVEKGLKSGALGLVSTTVIATASVAPAYADGIGANPTSGWVLLVGVLWIAAAAAVPAPMGCPA